MLLTKIAEISFIYASENFRRYTKRIHEGGLDSGYVGDPRLVVATFDNVDFGKRHGRTPFLLRVSMHGFDGERDALTATDTKRDKAARQTVTAHRVDQLGGQVERDMEFRIRKARALNNRLEITG